MKLDKEQVKYIREYYLPYDKDFGGAALARKFGVSRQAIHEVTNDKTHVDKKEGEKKLLEQYELTIKNTLTRLETVLKHLDVSDIRRAPIELSIGELSNCLVK